MDWICARDYYAELFERAQRAGVTQRAIAQRGGLSGQNLISRMLANHAGGPTVETFFRAIEGLGYSLPEFFAALAEREVAALIAPRPAPALSSIEKEGTHDAVVSPPLSQQDLEAFARHVAETFQQIATQFVASYGHPHRVANSPRSRPRAHSARRARKIS